MALPDIFTKPVTEKLIERIDKLTAASLPLWGKMSVAQMLAHCCISYEYVYDNNHKPPGTFMKFILKMFVKNKVTSEEPYKRNSGTAPDFIIKGDRSFETEKGRLTEYIRRTQDLGFDFFDGKESHSFGKLTGQEWNNMFYKHLDHHLTQFGV
ncbi:DUF1569 domain-containing protein [Dyadobacter sp. CY356]|uniref:DUF1569 domain-containing protein n=1 Tax=Dyadobacter sp. CY356 TaxID=2906442 RepID=UPI001F2857A7|nr:DUF1569 domain-containing protein [Dyadobacter sp. CY356]MCF0059662.1 DUF1569 domain-containing protein [Dyadobacter sp. CY356]